MGSLTMSILRVTLHLIMVGVTLSHVTDLVDVIDPEEKCKLPDVVLMVCDPLSSVWYKDVRRQGIKRSAEESDELENIKNVLENRSFSHTALPLPARIKFLLKIKKNFCDKQNLKREVCLEQARRSNGFGK